MGVRKLVEVACDFRDCKMVRVTEGTQVKAWDLAEQAGFVRRGIWTLCPDHAEAPVIHR